MSAELIGTLAVGATLFVSLGALILTGWLAMDRNLADLDLRLARVEGLLKGLGLAGHASYLTGRDAPECMIETPEQSHATVRE